MIKAPLLGGKIVAAVDAIEVFQSYCRGCEACCVRRVTIKNKDGEDGEVDQFYHRVIVLALMGEDFPLPLAVWPIRPGEDEVVPALELIRQVHHRFGPRFFDVLVADAIYGQAPFAHAIRELGLGLIFTLKANQPGLLGEAIQFTKDRPPDRFIDEKQNEKIFLWDEKDVLWDAARCSVRVVRSRRDRTLRERRSHVTRDEPSKRSFTKSWDLREESRENYFVALLDHPASAQGIYRAGKSRWDIDASLFQDLTDNWGLKHMRAHRPVAVLAMILVLLIAYALFNFYAYRQVLSHIRKAKPTLIAIATHLAETVRARGPP